MAFRCMRSMELMVQPNWMKYWLLFAASIQLVLLQLLRHSEAVTFSFPPYPVLFRSASTLLCTGWSQVNVNQDQWCRIRPDGASFELTPASGVGDSTFNTSSRIMYHEAIRFYDPETGAAASFSTFFAFHISRVKATFRLGSGMTFLIAPNVSTPEGSFGGELGLFDGWTDTNGNPKYGLSRIFAVEIDTYTRGQWDYPRSPHVGVDIDSVHSVNATYLWNDSEFSLQKIAVWIDYDAKSQYLEVRLMNITDSSTVRKEEGVVWLTYSGLNLSAHVNEYSYVGFSAAAASDAENRGQVHEIFDWTFSTNGISEGSSRSRVIGLALGLGSGVVIFVFVVFAVVLWRRRKQNKKNKKGRKKYKPRISGSRSLQDLGFSGVEGPREFGYQELKFATANFCAENVLGEGAFGKVHKGILADKSIVAIKRSAEDSSQGEREFIAEVSTIGKLRHKNLVPLKGWCKTYDELLLVYEYMPNGSLFSHLLYSNEDDKEPSSGTEMSASTAQQKPVLGWHHRYGILRGVASALHYLHAEWEEQTIIHRDVKSSNVMLDVNWNARLGDFGLARVVKRNSTAATVTRTAGTRGYLAPECVYRDKVGPESDVFSYGVLALEVASGRKPIEWFRSADEKFLVNWIWTLSKEDRLLGSADPRLVGDFHPGQMATVLKVGLLCCAEEPSQRPTMGQVCQYFVTGDVEVPTSAEWMPPLSYRSGAIFSSTTSSLGPSRDYSERTSTSVASGDMSSPAVVSLNRPNTVPEW